MNTHSVVATKLIAGMLATVCMLSGCAPSGISTGVFVDVTALENQLKRGISTKIDVQHALGVPKGIGGALLPTVASVSEVWFYDDIEATDYKSEGSGVITVNLRQQILLVFFSKDHFDGFMWFSNSLKGVAQ